MGMADITMVAESLCRERGVRLTPQRRQVLSIVAASDVPLGAYEILQELQNEQPGAAPPTVYRALEFLQQQGLVHRLATLQAYTVCDHPGCLHQSQFLICADCGCVEEVEDSNIQKSLDAVASRAGFAALGEVVEIVGRCGRCTVSRK